MLALKTGVAARLMAGLAILTLFAVSAGVLAVASFSEFRDSFDRVASSQLNAMVSAAHLQQESEALAGLAPGLLAKGFDQGSLIAFATTAYSRQAVLQQLVDNLRAHAGDRQGLAEIGAASEGLFGNADELSTVIFARANVDNGTQVALAELATLYREGVEGPQSEVAAQWLVALNALIAETLSVITIRDRDEVQYAEIRADRILSGVEKVVQDSDSPELAGMQERLVKAIRGSNGIITLQGEKLELEREIKHLLGQNDIAAQKLIVAVGALVSQIQADIVTQNDTLGGLLASRTRIMFALAVFGLIGALVIAAYFQRSVIGRLNRLRQAMRSGHTAEGVLDLAGGHDEIAEMARAFIHFVEEIDRRDEDVRQSQRRLTHAIESISDGFSLYDADDIMVTCNSRYRSMLYHGMEDKVAPGQHFEAIIRAAAESGMIPLAINRVNEWVAERLKQHRQPSATMIQLRGDGRWIEIRETRTDGGDSVAVYTDITERKNFELSLQEGKRRTEEANALAIEKNRMLESLSNKLSKYLSPQVYDSIFTGKQEVTIASKRKKLTIFFSDIADFTETTDNLESEQLTELLNSYLTEMSKIALQHGATIDKYVGDAILAFFGDPESRGVQEDAKACLTMAIAMQRRMQEIQAGWLKQGLERPFRLRIGINTGFCTVGNFGSEDRMDYTIIGNEVNLASRLQEHAPLGGILVAHETYALVHEAVACTERDPVQVKGFPKPIRNYEVLGIHDSVEGASTRLIDEIGQRMKVDLSQLNASERDGAIRSLEDVLRGLRE